MTKKELQLNVVFAGLELDQQQIADRLKVDRTAINHALKRRRKSEKLLEQIANVIAEDFKALVRADSTESITV